MHLGTQNFGHEHLGSVGEPALKSLALSTPPRTPEEKKWVRFFLVPKQWVQRVCSLHHARDEVSAENKTLCPILVADEHRLYARHGTGLLLGLRRAFGRRCIGSFGSGFATSLSNCFSSGLGCPFTGCFSSGFGGCLG